MPVRRKDTARALGLLEEYCSKLKRPEEQQLKTAILRVMGIFRSSLFQALLDIQEFYEVTLLNTYKSCEQKLEEANHMAEKWERSGSPTLALQRTEPREEPGDASGGQQDGQRPAEGGVTEVRFPLFSVLWATGDMRVVPERGCPPPRVPLAAPSTPCGLHLRSGSPCLTCGASADRVSDPEIGDDESFVGQKEYGVVCYIHCFIGVALVLRFIGRKGCSLHRWGMLLAARTLPGVLRAGDRNGSPGVRRRSCDACSPEAPRNQRAYHGVMSDAFDAVARLFGVNRRNVAGDYK